MKNWKAQGGRHGIMADDEVVALVRHMEDAQLVASAPEIYNQLDFLCSYIEHIEFKKKRHPERYPDFPKELFAFAETGRKLISRIDKWRAEELSKWNVEE